MNYKIKCFLQAVVSAVVFSSMIFIVCMVIIATISWAVKPENIDLAVTIMETILGLFVLFSLVRFFYYALINDILNAENKKSSGNVSLPKDEDLAFSEERKQSND